MPKKILSTYGYLAHAKVVFDVLMKPQIQSQCYLMWLRLSRWFLHLPPDLASINAWKNMFDPMFDPPDSSVGRLSLSEREVVGLKPGLTMPKV